MAQYVTRCSIEFNGIVYEDIKGFTEKSVSLSVPVALMNKSGTAKLMPRYGFSIDSVQPTMRSLVNPRSLFGATATVQYDNGDRVSFGGVATTSTGDGTINGETEAGSTIDFSAESRTPDLELR